MGSIAKIRKNAAKHDMCISFKEYNINSMIRIPIEDFLIRNFIICTVQYISLIKLYTVSQLLLFYSTGLEYTCT